MDLVNNPIGQARSPSALNACSCERFTFFGAALNTLYLSSATTCPETNVTFEFGTLSTYPVLSGSSPIGLPANAARNKIAAPTDCSSE